MKTAEEVKEERNKAGFVLNGELTAHQQDLIDNTHDLREFVIDAMLSFASQDKWISVEERLPDADVDVLGIDCNDSECYICSICGEIGGWFDSVSGSNNHITHWMPLPKAPNTNKPSNEMENIKITLTYEEAVNLYQLVQNSSDTGNEDWDKTMKSIEQKINEKI